MNGFRNAETRRGTGQHHAYVVASLSGNAETRNQKPETRRGAGQHDALVETRNQKPETRRRSLRLPFWLLVSAFCFFLSGFWFLVSGFAVTVDRIAALIDREVLTVSEVSQMVELRFFARKANQSE